MARARPEPQAEIEILPEHSLTPASSSEVMLGPARTPRRRALTAGVVLVVAGLLVVAAQSKASAPTPSSVIPLVTVATSGPSTSRSVASSSDVPGDGASTPLVSSPPSKVGPVLPFGTPTGVGVYMRPASQADAGLILYDIDRGEVRSFAPYEYGYHRAIDGAGGVVVDASTVMRLQSTGITQLAGGSAGGFEPPVGRVAAGPAGGVWVRDTGMQRLVLLSDQAQAGTVYDLPAGADLVGSMADGRPVVRGADLRSYVIEASGTRSLLSSGLTSLVEHGRFTDITCDDQQHCGTVGHLDGQKRGIALAAELSVRFQADGPWLALVAPDEGLTLLNGQTGAEIKVRMTEHIAYEAPALNLISAGPNVWFLPGARGVVAGTSSGLVFIDMRGEIVGSVPYVGGAERILGLGTALTNPAR